MPNENSLSQIYTQIATAWRTLQSEVARKQDEIQRAKEYAQWEAMWASTIAAIDQHDVPQPVEPLSRLYLDLELTFRRTSDHTFRAIIRTHQQRIFAAICVAINANGVASEAVETLAILAQACMRERVSANTKELPTELLACQRRVTETLRVSLKPSLIAMIFSRGWVNSWEKAGVFDDFVSYPTQYARAEALALIGFGYVLEYILTPRLDLDRNIAALLVTIAHRGIAAEYRALQEKQTIPLTDSPELASDVLEQELIDHIANREIGETVWEYIDKQLRPIEQHIIYRRWRDQPPGSSTAIAAELGEGWNANRVDVAHHRILKKIRRYLHSLEES